MLSEARGVTVLAAAEGGLWAIDAATGALNREPVAGVFDLAVVGSEVTALAEASDGTLERLTRSTGGWSKPEPAVGANRLALADGAVRAFVRFHTESPSR